MSTRTTKRTPDKKSTKSSKPSDKWIFGGGDDDIRQHYKLGARLGEPGQFGYAVEAVHKKTGERRAVKVISKGRFSRKSDRRFHFQQLQAEIRVMKRMKHQNIIRMYEKFETPTELYIVMELCQGGELFDRIKKQGNYSEKDAARVLLQMTEGIRYMHSKKIAHCDLKPDNFLFLGNSKEAPLKIIDFGMSKFVQSRKYFKSLCGTPYYVAPEVIRARYSEHCDMWSLGVVMFVMLFGYPPFYDTEDSEIFKLVTQGFNPVVKDGYGAHFPASMPISESARDLIAKLLTLDTAKRLTAEEALKHPWLRGDTASDKPLVQNVLVNLEKFSAQTKLKQGVLNMMTDTLSDHEIQELKDTFKTIDINGDGKISLNELTHAMAKTGEGALSETNKAQMRKMMDLADVDGDGELSYEELLMTTVQRKISAKEERLYQAFCKLDLNGDGKVTPEELEQVLGNKYGLSADLIRDVDRDGDGNIDYDEFLQMWTDREEKKGEKKSKSSH